MNSSKKWWFSLTCLLIMAMVLVACGGGDTAPAEEAAAPAEEAPPVEEEAMAEEAPAEEAEAPAEEMTEGAIELSMWYHGAGNEVESAIVRQIIDDFNSSQSNYTIVLEDFPQDSYNESVVAGALAGDLPDIIDMDGPVMPNWAWAGYLSPLELSEGTLDGFLPGTIGSWDGEVYSVGLWDAAIAVYARRSVLEENGIRIPTLDEPWTGEEFDVALETLQATGDYEYAFDPGMAWTGEWYPYAFSPHAAKLRRRHHRPLNNANSRRCSQR